ncbi:MAG TPA: cytochrome c oxidase assembly protein [Caulobacteraceae bacterium]|nr:cytochrome c oxidase assembly protein [Caulobacteraceae bacterium]
MSPRPTASDPLRRRNAQIALICGVVFCGMVGAAFAAVPLYKVFCQATGFNGTVRRAEHASATVSDRTVNVGFDTNVRGLDWRFVADQGVQLVRLGDSKLAFFEVTNNADTPLTGRAVYNVSPESVGPYFSKLQCFCFSNQTVQPHQTVRFPVVYYVDPRFGTDDDTRGIGQITLSYTFYPAPKARGPLANSPQGYSTGPVTIGRGGDRASGAAG